MALMSINNGANNDRHSSPSQINLFALPVPLAKSVVLTLVVFTSTGVYIRKLFWLALCDTLAISVAFLWVLGDFLPCVALSKLAFDFSKDITERRRVNVRELIFPRSFLAAVLNTFALLYLIDAAIRIRCRRLGPSSSQDECHRMLLTFEKAFFHIQVTLSILNLTKPWLWSRLDLRRIIKNLERFYLLAYKMAHSISSRLDSSAIVQMKPYNEARQSEYRVGERAVTGSPAKSSAVLSSQSELVTTGPDILSQREPSGLNNHSQRRESRRSRVASRTPSSARKATATVIRRGRSSLATSNRRSITSRSVSSRSRASYRVGTRRGKSLTLSHRRGRVSVKATTVKGHSCIGVSDGTRTVNLNLNMS